LHFTCVLVFKFNLLLGANIFVGYESLQSFTKEKTLTKLGEKKEQEERTNIQSKDNTQKHKNTNGGHKKEQWGAPNGNKRTFVIGAPHCSILKP
jgi:hypothetical protein